MKFSFPNFYCVPRQQNTLSMPPNLLKLDVSERACRSSNLKTWILAFCSGENVAHYSSSLLAMTCTSLHLLDSTSSLTSSLPIAPVDPKIRAFNFFPSINLICKCFQIPFLCFNKLLGLIRIISVREGLMLVVHSRRFVLQTIWFIDFLKGPNQSSFIRLTLDLFFKNVLFCILQLISK